MLVSIPATTAKQKILQLLQQESSSAFFNTSIHDIEELPVPVQQLFLMCRGPIVSLWVVLDEHPEMRMGKVIVFDEECERFGVAEKKSNVKMNSGFFLFYCSSFNEAMKKVRLA